MSSYRPNEASILRGKCPDCGKPMKIWTEAEIKEAKCDIGMADEDDFSDVCGECIKTYVPEEVLSIQ